MKKLIILSVLLSFPALADAVITDISCANGAGKIVNGGITGQYCMSNNTMNWWNAVSWCDAQGLSLITNISLDCGCSDTISNCSGARCPNLDPLTDGFWIQSIKRGTTQSLCADRIERTPKIIVCAGIRDSHYALCKM